jgi:hypothetical protein
MSKKLVYAFHTPTISEFTYLIHTQTSLSSLRKIICILKPKNVQKSASVLYILSGDKIHQWFLQ